MYENLKVELFRKGISQKEVADYLQIHENSVRKKIMGGSFSVEEVFKIKNRFFPEYDLTYLFKRVEKTNPA